MHRIAAANAGKIWDWFQTRGGIAIWKTLNLSDPGQSWTTPMLAADGQPPKKPHSYAESSPSTVITDPTQVVVDVPKLVKRFHVAVRAGDQGLSLKVTDGGSRRIRRECEKAGEESWYEFDYGDHENCLIFAPSEESLTLPEYIAGLQAVPA